MNMRVNLLSVVVAFAIVACNAYATRPGVASRVGRSHSHRRNINERAASLSAYERKRYFPIVKDPTTQSIGDSPLTKQDTALLSKNFLTKKAVNDMALSSAVVLLLVVTVLFRQPIGTYSLKLLENYKSSMASFPLQTKVTTGATLAVLGDGLAQLRDPMQTSYNPRRATSFAAFDGCYRFFQHHAFPYIISMCRGNVLAGILMGLSGASLGVNVRQGLAALERTLVYQFLVIPLLYYPIFFSFTGYLQGLSVEQIVSRAKTSFLPCWKRNLLFWIPTQVVMFGLIDEKWQIPFACVMGMLWSMVLSVTAGNATKKA